METTISCVTYSHIPFRFERKQKKRTKRYIALIDVTKKILITLPTKSSILRHILEKMFLMF